MSTNPKAKFCCIYHSADADGNCCAAIIKQEDPHAVLVPWNYGRPIPWDMIPTGLIVIVADVTLTSGPGYNNFDDMKLLRTKNPMVWIDHHEKAIQAAEQAGVSYRGIQRPGLGACVLVWEYFHGQDKKPLPEAVELIARYDVGDISDQRIVDFHYGLRLYDNRPWKAIWRDILAHPNVSAKHVATLLQEGGVISRYVTRESEHYCRTTAFQTEIDGHSALAINRALVNGHAFDGIKTEGCEILITFYWSCMGNWKVSLYRTPDSTVDCATIAEQHGGGGHNYAASFLCATLPFELRAKPVTA